MTEEVWQLPVSLRITNPKVREAADRQQADLAAKVNNPFVRLSLLEAERAWAIRREVETRRALMSVSGTDTARLLKGRLAEALASQGRYDEAAECDERPEYKAEYQSIHAALSRDIPRCDCVHHQFTHEGRKQHRPQEFVKRQVFDVQTGKFVELRKCNGCGRQRVMR